MQFERVPLEDWMREFYFDTPLDLGSSGLRPYGFEEVKRLVGITPEDLDRVMFDDSDTMGARALRTAIAERWGDGNPENVMVGNGSNDAAFLLMAGLLQAGDEVVTTDPIYHTHDKIAVSLGCKLKRCALRPENGFRVDMDVLLGLITPGTKMVVVNFPHNPTGTSLTRDEQKQLIAACEAVDAILVWDAALQELVFEGEPLPNPFPEYHKAIVIGTMSKAYGMPGIRVGWCIGKRELFEGSVLWKDFTSLYVSPWVEVVAEKAIRKAHVLRDNKLGEIRENLKDLEAWMAANSDLVSWTKPMGGVTAFVKLHGMTNTEAFCKSLAAERGVMVVPGSAFNHPTHVRLGYAGVRDQFQEGLKRLAEHLRAWPQHAASNGRVSEPALANV